MRDEEAERPAKRIVHEVGCDLSSISLEELAERIALLETEIARIRAEEDRKRASRTAAASVFRV